MYWKCQTEYIIDKQKICSTKSKFVDQSAESKSLVRSISRFPFSFCVQTKPQIKGLKSLVEAKLFFPAIASQRGYCLFEVTSQIS